MVFDKKKIKKNHNIFMFKDSSLQENLLFQNSKKFWELFFLSFSEKKTENTKWNKFSHSLFQMILYILLRSDENPLAWLRAEDPSSSVFVEYHVTHGSSLNAIPSRYISCYKSLEAVVDLQAASNRLWKLSSTEITRPYIA